MAGTWSDVTNAIKIAYPNKSLETMANDDLKFRPALKRGVPAGGRVSEGRLKFGASMNSPQNIGPGVDGGSLVSPVDRTEDQFELGPQLMTAGFQIGWVTKKAAKSNKSAFNGGELRRRTEETVADFGKYIEKLYTATHGTGRFGTVESGTSASASFVVAKPEGSIFLLRENMRISVRTTDGGNTVRDSCDLIKISSIDTDTRTVTLATGTYTLVAGDHIHVVAEAAQTLAPNYSSAGTGNLVQGLRGIVDDSTYSVYVNLLSRNTYPKLKATVAGNSGTLRDLTEQILISAIHKVRHKTGKTPKELWTNTGQVEKYIEFVAPDRRYVVSGKGRQGMGTGYQEDDLVHYAPGVALKFNVSTDIVPREIFILDWAAWFLYSSMDMQWWDEGEMLKPTPNSTTYKASYLAFMGCIENIGCDYPMSQLVIRDLKDPLCAD